MIEKALPESRTFSDLESRARLAYENRDFEEAKRLMRVAATFDDADESNFFNLGQILYETGEYLAAIDAYGKSIPGVPDALVSRGLAWELIGDDDRARHD